MTSIENAVILALALGAAPAAWASDAFSDAHDDSPSASVERGSSVMPDALAPDAQDESGWSARAFDPRSGAAAADAYADAYALTSDAHDDAGTSSRRLELDPRTAPTGGRTNEKSAAAQGGSTTPAHQCVCML
jgi:hypothetical protein